VNEIQRWTPSGGAMAQFSAGSWVKHSDHLAALEAQAEEHRTGLEGKDRYIEVLQAELESQLEEYEAGLTRQEGSWHRMMEDRKTQHAKDLAEKCAKHAKTFRRLVEERNDADQRADRFAQELAEARGEGEPASVVKHYRKKPIEVEAIQYTGHNDMLITRWSERAVSSSPVLEPTKDNPTGSYLQIKTPEGVLTAIVGDWIIKGAVGKFYLCKPDAFEAMFETGADDA